MGIQRHGESLAIGARLTLASIPSGLILISLPPPLLFRDSGEKARASACEFSELRVASEFAEAENRAMFADKLVVNVFFEITRN